MTLRTGAAVRLEGIGKRYGEVQAVKPLDLTIEAGTLVTLLGPSGCGKTTLLRMIAGLEQSTEGRLFIGDRDVTLLPAGARNVSMVFQSYALFPHMSVLENVGYGLVSSGMRKRDAHAKAEAVLETVGLKGFGARLPSEMSGGQQQRVAVARALVLEPDVLLFDEPLSNLDARLRRSMREEIRMLQQRLGLTVVYVTHDQSEALAVSDRIVVMRNAGIAQAGTPRELYTAPDSIFVATFMGEANQARGVVESVADGIARVRIGGVALDLPARGIGPGPVDVVIRPEGVRLATEGEAAIPASVIHAIYMGAHAECRFDTPVGELFVIAPRSAAGLAPGDKVGLALDNEGIVLVPPG